MGFFGNFLRRISLTETQRHRLVSFFGSFNANRFALDNTSLITNSYESNVDVYSLIRKIVDVSKSIPWIVEQKTSEGIWEIIENTPIHDLMATPNVAKGYTWDNIQEQRLVYLLATGNSFMLGEKGIDEKVIGEVDILPPFTITIRSNENFFIPIKNYRFDLGTSKRNFLMEDIQHTTFFNPGYRTVNESFHGLSPIQVAARAIQVSNDRWDADASLLQNRGAIGMITDKSQRPMTKEEARDRQNSFDADNAGPHRFGRIHVTNKDLNFVQIAMSSVDLQLVEKGVINLRAISNVFGLDSSLFNDPANKTFNNRLEAEKSMFTNAIIPLSEKLAAADTAFIAKSFFPDGDVRMRQDFSEVKVLQKDQKTEADKDKVVIDGINIIINMATSFESKVALLVEQYEFTEEEAKVIATPSKPKTQPTQSDPNVL